MELNLIRGDTYVLEFSLRDDEGNPYYLGENDKCYFTVKRSEFFENFVLQKTWSDGIVFNSETQTYQISLSQDDTNLAPQEYVYDIKVKIGDDIVKTLTIDKITIIDNVTHKENE